MNDEATWYNPEASIILETEIERKTRYGLYNRKHHDMMKMVQ